MSEGTMLDSDPRFDRADHGAWRLRAAQSLPVARARLFSFFSDARNLTRITPPEMGFQIVTPSPIVMGEGTLIDYRVRVAGVPLRWRSLITRWEPPHEFADEQLRGPYAQWVHRHRFTKIAEDVTLMEDEVLFRLPFAPLSAPAAPFVRRQLRWIFRYRREVIERMIADGVFHSP